MLIFTAPVVYWIHTTSAVKNEFCNELHDHFHQFNQMYVISNWLYLKKTLKRRLPVLLLTVNANIPKKFYLLQLIFHAFVAFVNFAALKYCRIDYN